MTTPLLCAEEVVRHRMLELVLQGYEQGRAQPGTDGRI